MKFKFLSIFLICLMLFSTIGMASAASTSKYFNSNEIPNQTIVVNDLTVNGLQNAIDNAIDGDTIIINGSINGKGYIRGDKSLSVVGQNNCNLVKINWYCTKDMVFKNISLSGCYQNGDGGAIYCEGSINIYNSEFTNNSAKFGGAVFSMGDVNVYGSLFKDNRIPHDDGYHGGAIFSDSSVNIVDSNFTDNFAYNFGGAIFASKYISVNGSCFENNKCSNPHLPADSLGGAIYSEGSVDVYASNFTGNFAYDFGGAIYSTKDINLFGSLFDGNDANDNNGGAICSMNIVNIHGSKFIKNEAREDGGAVWSDDGVYVDDSSFDSNLVNDAVVSQCEGGAIYSNGGSVILKNSNFTNNYAYDYGGTVWSDDDVTVQNCLFKNNSVTDNDGGAIYMDDDCDLRVSDSSFYGNSASDKGGAIYCEGNSAHVYLDSYNSFENNTAKEGSVVFADGYFESLKIIGGEL